MTGAIISKLDRDFTLLTLIELLFCRDVTKRERGRILSWPDYEIMVPVPKIMAGRQGFEPRSGGPEPPVLPLDDLPALTATYSRKPNPDFQDQSEILPQIQATRG